MKFVDIVENLQKQNPGKIILVKNGIFFVALGKDAIVLSEKIGLKRTCMKDNLCKVGFLVKSSEKYIKILENENLSFRLFIMDKVTEKLEEIYQYEGDKIEEICSSLNCKECLHRKETDEDVLERLRSCGK